MASAVLAIATLCATSARAGSADNPRAPASVEESRANAAADALVPLSAGIPVNGFPNWEERVVQEWMNRARSDPQFEMARCGTSCGEAACYKPALPLMWNENLNRAARFHAEEMFEQEYFSHDSRCTIVSTINSLYPAGCRGQASCGCVGGSVSCSPSGCTPWSTRVGLFGSGATGEIISSTTDPNRAFYSWLFESSQTTQCQFSFANGHRWNILNSNGAVGVGVGAIGNSVGDFGRDDQVPSRIVSAAHFPRQAASVEIWANWYDTAPPRSASAVVDGVCTPMSLQRGTLLNGAWVAAVQGVATGCHRYFVSFVDASGVTLTYPSSGSLAIGDPNSCADWSSARTNGTCSAARRRGHGVRR